MPGGSVTDVSSIDDLILAIVATVTAAVDYPVFDGPITSLPSRDTTQFVLIGADSIDTAKQGQEESPPTESAEMTQIWKGLGQVARYEDARINCVAVGRGTTVANARALAFLVVKDVGQHIGLHPTTNSYNALVSEVVNVKAKPTSGGAYVHVQFTISANARLT
jgi:hypothetical protein